MAPKQARYMSLLCLVFGGCACVATKQDWEYKLAQQHRAAQAWRCGYSAEQQKCLSCDFESGFKTGYFDTSIGRDCRVPPVAPAKYWKAKYQSCEGQQAVQDWFRGYQEGIAAAQSAGHVYFNEVPVSAHAPVTNITACGKCRSYEPCECILGAGTAVSEPMQWHETLTVLERESGASVEATASGWVTHVQSKTTGRSEIGLIGGFGAADTIMFGPMDPAVLPN